MMGLMRKIAFIFIQAQKLGQESRGIFPPEASTIASEVDRFFLLILAVTAFFFFLISGLIIAFSILYRYRPGQRIKVSPHHSLPLELAWTVVPTILALIIFVLGFKGYMSMAVAPLESYEIRVTGQRWNWLFTYENGHVDNELHVPPNVPVTLTLTSQDVIHSLFIPAFRLKRDAVPGRYSKIWFQATKPGEYPIYCAEYCGRGHSTMLTKVVVHEPGKFEKWLEDASSFVKRLPPIEAGRKLYETRGCMQCHSVDGKVGIGPSFLGIFGQEVNLRGNQKLKVDENYLRESIVEPGAKVVAGFEPVMPTYKGRLKEEEISAIIAFIKSLSAEGKGVATAKKEESVKP